MSEREREKTKKDRRITQAAAWWESINKTPRSGAAAGTASFCIFIRRAPLAAIKLLSERARSKMRKTQKEGKKIKNSERREKKVRALYPTAARACKFGSKREREEGKPRARGAWKSIKCSSARLLRRRRRPFYPFGSCKNIRFFFAVGNETLLQLLGNALASLFSCVGWGFF